jgi:hypothetical protein
MHKAVRPEAGNTAGDRGSGKAAFACHLHYDFIEGAACVGVVFSGVYAKALSLFRQGYHIASP